MGLKRTKIDYDGLYVKYNIRLIFKFFSQVHGVYYRQTFASVEKMDSIKLFLAIATSKQWEMHHMDVKSDFIHGECNASILNPFSLKGT